MDTLDKAQFRKAAAWGIALIWVAFQLYIAFRAGIPTIVQRTVHVAFACTVVFLTKPLQKDDKFPWFALDLACTAACLATVFYIMRNGERFLSRIAYIAPVYVSDIVMGALVIVLLIECCRRCLGMSMTLVVTLGWLHTHRFWTDDFIPVVQIPVVNHMSERDLANTPTVDRCR